MIEAWLEDNRGKKTPISGTFTIGRSSRSSLQLDSDQVSRQHALIHSQNEAEHWLVDLGSTNGTICRQRRVQHPIALTDGDIIQIGSSQLTYRSREKNARVTRSLSTRPITRRPLTRAPHWLLLADIERSSALVQKLSLDQFAMTVGQWFKETRAVVEKNSGLVSQYLGDGFFAQWLVAAGSDKAVRNAIRQLEELRSDKFPPFRIVLHHAEIAVDSSGLLGGSNLLGPDVHFLFRMEKVAGANRWPLTLSKTAAAALAKIEPSLPLGSADVPGFPGKHEFFAFGE
jgi:pSer/pThr/pTyr-binding forkhead associated (FHA) protein